MSANFVLHIGTSKTGSSAVQLFLRRNALALAERGYLVPDRHLGLGSDITGEHVWGFQEYINAGNGVGLTARLEQAAELAGSGKTIIMSAENLSNLGNHRYFEGICKSHDVRIIVYIRRQDELLTSAWQQWHSKVESDFGAWLVRGLQRYGRWDRLTKDWEDLVGAGKIAVRLFEREAMIGKDLIRDFLATIGFGEQAEHFDCDMGVVNPSFTDVITPLVAGNTRLFDDINDNRFFNFLSKVAPSAVSGDKKISIISKEMRNSIISYYNECNLTVKNKYFPGRPRLFGPIDHSKYHYLAGDELFVAQLQLLMELIYKSHQNLDSRK